MPIPCVITTKNSKVLSGAMPCPGKHDEEIEVLPSLKPQDWPDQLPAAGVEPTRDFRPFGF